MMKTLILATLMFAAVPQAQAVDTPCPSVRAAFDKNPRQPHLHYGMAFCAAREGDADTAFRYLAGATERGFRDVDLLLRDPDFRQLRSDPRWPVAVAKMVLARKHYMKEINHELLAIFEADQGDRKSDDIDWSVVSGRDKERNRRVRQMLKAGQVRHSDDYYHAAMVFQHGMDADDIRLAKDYAKHALHLDPNNGRAAWLACAAEDRWLHRIHKPQIWGTQYMNPGNGKWTQEPFDRTAKTDAERRAMGVQTLAESAARLEEMNGK